VDRPPETRLPNRPTFQLELREVVDDDLPILFEHQRDPLAVDMMAFPARERAAFDAHWERIRADPTVTLRTIVVDGAVVGSIVTWIDESGERDVGYGLGREAWGRGIATAALAEFVRIVPHRPLHGRVAKRNPASLRVLQKNGFEIVGEGRWLSGYGTEPIEELILRLD
jgi:RimJ/RimL family protein N-acetyltransferase